MIDSTKIKYINKIISDIEEELDQREKDMIRDKRSRMMNKPERAVARAILKQTRKIYVRARQNLLLTGLENQRNYNPDVFGLKTAEEYEVLHHAHVDEIKEIIQYSNLVIDAQDNADKPSLNRSIIEREQHLAKLHSQTLPAILRTAFETLAKYGLLSEALDIAKFKFVSSNLGSTAPRGDPLKGGLVKTLMAKGYAKSDALIEANELLAKGASSVNQEHLTDNNLTNNPIHITPEMQKVMDNLTSVKKKSDKTNLLDILNASEEELLEKYGSGDKVKPEIDLGNIDQSDAPEF